MTRSWLDHFRLGSTRSNDELSARALRKIANAAAEEKSREEKRRIAAHNANERQVRLREEESKARERQANQDALVTACQTHISNFLSTLDASLMATAKRGGTRLTCELGIDWGWWQTKLGDHIEHHEPGNPSRQKITEALRCCPAYLTLTQTCHARRLRIVLSEIRKEEPSYDYSQWGRRGTARWVLVVSFQE